MKLEDLVGLHDLTGVDMSNESINTYGDWYENCEVINFVLDGKTYVAIEDPSDGYRSMMGDIVVSDYEVQNKFPPCRVMCKMRDDGLYDKNDILDCIDTVTGKIVLSVGTENYDDYYPYFVADFNPENMAINQVND